MVVLCVMRAKFDLGLRVRHTPVRQMRMRKAFVYFSDHKAIFDFLPLTLLTGSAYVHF